MSYLLEFPVWVQGEAKWLRRGKLRLTGESNGGAGIGRAGGSELVEVAYSAAGASAAGAASSAGAAAASSAGASGRGLPRRL